ncbi:MAG TPA: DNA repair exonuclease [Acidimicrobiales bacterium]|nr:DNA repair exonuclease [Acidimicrobiales bacterium]
MAEAPPSFVFVHAADLHLDTPFEGIGAVAPEVAAALRDASLDAFDALVDLTLSREAAFLLVAGDVYDGARRGLRAQLRFRDGLKRLAAAGIQSFVVHGNHDPLDEGWSAVSRWPEGVTIFGSDAVRVVPVERGGTQIATVQGISYATAATTENLARRLSRPDGPGVHVGLLHCNVGGAGGHANYSPCSLDDLAATGLDYLALGHVHERSVLARGRGPGEAWIAYPGNLQARSPKPSEAGAKGALVVHVEHGVIAEVEFVPCDLVRFAEVRVPLDAADDLADLRDRLVEAGRAELAGAQGRSIVLRARLVGSGTLHEDLARPGSREALLDDLRALAPTATPFVWWDALVDETRPALDLDEVRRRNDFSADLLAIAQRLADDRSPLAASTGLAASLPRALARRVEAILEGATRRELVEEATLVALEAIEREP